MSQPSSNLDWQNLRLSDRAQLEMYQAFMSGYVRRINEATLKVTIGGIRIGSAKYTRLAQINLRSRIITFSRFAIENVPERGRRYLVLHELAHVKESNHTKRFWELVGDFEPEYKRVGKSLQTAFAQNVRTNIKKTSSILAPGKLITYKNVSDVLSVEELANAFSDEQDDDMDGLDCTDFDPAMEGGSDEEAAE